MSEVMIPIGVHKCDQDDWDQFYDKTKKYESQYLEMKENNSAWCFNPKD